MITPQFAQTTMGSPFGPIEIAATARGVIAVAVRTTPDAVAADVRRRLGRNVETAALDQDDGAPQDDLALAKRWVAAARHQLTEYVVGSRVAYELVLDLSGLTAWDRRILEGVRTIVHGRTVGYGQLARAVGSPGAARAAGGSVGRNPVALVIPCHRVIAGDGTLGGYGGAWAADRDELLDLKAELLAHEGVHVARMTRAA